MKYAAGLFLILLWISPGLCQDPTQDRLGNSPRHQEWIDVKSATRNIHSFVVYPQKQDKVPVIVVIHENKGLTDWVRTVADRLAESGYVAIAPDLLSGMAPKGGNTPEFASPDAATQAIYHLSPGEVTRDLDAVADAALKLPASNGKLAVAGFCWGGGQSFRFATHRPNLRAAFVFYGSFDYTREALQKISASVYGFYGAKDSRINSTLSETKTLMKQLHKTFEAEIYEDADHAFMRKGEETDASAGNKKAHDAAWDRWLKILATL